MTDDLFYDPVTYDLEIGASNLRKERAEFYAQLAKGLGSPILEIGSGTGKNLISIAEQGINVTGIDNSSRMLDYCRNKLDSLPEDIRSRISLHYQDMVDMTIVPHHFRGVFLPYHVFFHLLSEDAIRSFLHRAFQSMAPGGRLVMDVFFPNPAYLAEGYQESAEQRYLSETFIPDQHIYYLVHRNHTYNPISQHLTERFRYELLNEEREVMRAWYRTLQYRLATPNEIRLHLELAGFRSISISTAFDESAYHSIQNDLVIYAYKPI